MSLAPWGVVGQGRFRTDEEEERRRQTGEKGRMISRPDWERNENEKKISKALEEVAKQVGAKTITAGKNRVRSRKHFVLNAIPSRHRIRDAKNTLCLPNYRW